MRLCLLTLTTTPGMNMAIKNVDLGETTDLDPGEGVEGDRIRGAGARRVRLAPYPAMAIGLLRARV